MALLWRPCSDGLALTPLHLARRVARRANTAEQGERQHDKLMLRVVSEGAAHGNVVTLPTATLEGCDGEKKVIKELCMHEGQVCCLISSSTKYGDSLLGLVSVITAHPQLKG